MSEPITPNELKRLYPGASASTIARNRQAGGATSSAVPEPIVRHEPVAAAGGEAKNTGRYVVGIRSFRARLCDPDNLCPKYFIDCLRYAGSIHDDRLEDIEIRISQHKVKSRKQERTEITIERLT